MKLRSITSLLLGATIALTLPSCADEQLPRDREPEPELEETKTVTVNGVTFKMKLVEAGTFTMGATAEQTEADKAAYLEQAKYVAKFDKMMNEGKIEKVVVMKKEEMEEIEAIEAEGCGPANESTGTGAEEEPGSETAWDGGLAAHERGRDGCLPSGMMCGDGDDEEDFSEYLDAGRWSEAGVASV